MPAMILRRAGAAAVLSGLAFAATAPAHAASGELTYTCTLFGFPQGFDVESLDATERKLLDSAKGGEFSTQGLAEEIPGLVEVHGLKASAAFDSAIEDGATAAPGATVELEPVAGSFEFAPEVGAELRKLGITEGFAGAMLFAGIEETGLERETEFFFDTVSVPESDALTLTAEDGVAQSFRVNAAGTFTYTAGDFEFFIATDDENPEDMTFAGLSCIPDDDQDLTIDQVDATAKPAPTTPAPTTPAPTTS
ncbi:hypothetical protein, partial [Knoellia sinensis]|uniref:hypothetical protein n=1 Tax=Knoellia sinensis TaxID=136100 RepID=UPI0012EBABFC